MSAAPATALQLHTDSATMLVTMRLGDQLFGIPVLHVRDVLREQRIAHIPLAAPEIAGSLNLRGRIVTVIDARKRLRLPPRAPGEHNMFVVVEHKHELYSLMVDSVGDVMDAPTGSIEKSPGNIKGAWRDIASGVWRLNDELLVVVDVNALLTLKA